MDPITLVALIGAATSAIQGISGAVQMSRAKKLEEQYPRPTAQTADAIKRLLGYSYGRTLDQDIPGGELYRNEIKGATSAGIRAATQLGAGSEAYGMLGKLVQGEQSSIADLARLTAQQVSGARGDYMNVLSGPAYQEERRVDYWNKELPYLQAAEKAMQLRNSGAQNMMAGVKNIAGVASAAAQPDIYTALYGKGYNTGSGQMTLQQIEEYIKKMNIGAGVTNSSGIGSSNNFGLSTGNYTFQDYLRNK
jgi:hypothetical protein